VLNVIPIFDNHQKTPYFRELSSDSCLHIVSTAEAKRRLQLKNLQNADVISTHNILRATEFWSTLFQINCPKKHLVSDSLLFALIENWYRTENVDVEFQDIQRFKTFCDQIFPVLISQEKKLFYDWIQEDKERSRRLLGWVKTAELFLKYLRSRNMVGSAWMLSTLLMESEIYFGSFEKFVIDLGNEIQPEEVQLLLRLSETHDVQVLAPVAEYLTSYRSGRSYQKLDLNYIKFKSEPRKASTQKLYLRSGSVLSEVKSITAYIRELLDSGIPTQAIAVACSDPESYWDVFKKHLDVEGVPVDKAVVAKATSLPYFQEWLSRIKILIQMYTSGDLESFLNTRSHFTKNKEAYNDFKKNFSRLYDVSIANVLLTDVHAKNANEVLAFPEFVSFLYATWIHSDYRLYNKMVDALIKDFSPSLKMTFAEWNSYLSLILARLETSIEAADRGGIAFAGPHQLDHMEYSHLIVLGCHRGAMQMTNNTPFIPEDVSRLENDLGYYLPPCEDKKVEFDMMWAASPSSVTTLLSYAETDFNGDPTVVSQMWLTWSREAQALTLKNRARWDQIISQASLDALDGIYKTKMTREQDIKAWVPLAITYNGRFSVSALQTYKNCPFTFFATRVMNQEEIKELDLEIDPMFQGSFLHRILEILLGEYPSLTISEDELSKLYQSVLESKEVSEDIRPDVLMYWKREKYRHLLMIRQFIAAELEWRKLVPQTQTDSLETMMSGFIGIKDGHLRLQSDNKKGFYPFAAKIDRIDKDQKGNIGVFDYKTSKPGDFKSFEKWPESFQIQMPLYAIGIETGLVEKYKNSPVVLASYIFLKDGTRGSGYVLQGVEHGFSGAITSSRSKQNVLPENRNAVFENLQNQIKESIESVEQGKYFPLPLDTEDCQSCHWRKACRAPHLK
jgi:ATP-dependent helicase/nuclease subunit B